MTPQKELFLKNLPATRTELVKIFAKHGGAPTSVTAIAWQLKKARKIKLCDDGKFRKTIGTKR